MGQFSTVIWVGNSYGGDLGSWQQTSILPYLEAGGNLLLMTRRGQEFIYSDLREYLGISWAEDPHATIRNCIATFPGLTDISFTGDQTSNAVFETDLSSDESRLIFQETATFGVPRGLGVWRRPHEGGSYRSNGGQFVFISGRPYRYNAEQLRNNTEFILGNFFLESSSSSHISEAVILEQNYPNPFNLKTTVRFCLSQPLDVTIHIYNIQGKLIKSLLNEEFRGVGFHSIEWDGKDRDGKIVSAGVYFIKLKTDTFTESKKMIYLSIKMSDMRNM